MVNILKDLQLVFRSFAISDIQTILYYGFHQICQDKFDMGMYMDFRLECMKHNPLICALVIPYHLQSLSHCHLFFVR